MKYYIGIDGGGTKSTCILVDEQKKQLCECKGGPTNFLHIGAEKAAETIFNLIESCKEKNKVHQNQIESVFIGTTGGGRRVEAQSLEKALRVLAHTKHITYKNMYVESDALVALEGAFNGNPGSILIAGTGSIMYGKDSKDRVYRVGGCGRIIGDEGSAFQLGRKGLISIARHLDGRGESTLMTQFLQRDYKIEFQEDLITEIYSHNFDIANFSRTVVHAAEQGDLSALKIVQDEINELIEHIRTMHRKITVQNLEVCFIGSLITTENFFSNTLNLRITEELPDIRLKKAKSSPAFGAVLLGLKRIYMSQNM